MGQALTDPAAAAAADPGLVHEGAGRPVPIHGVGGPVPTVVLLHAAGLDHRMWRPVHTRLTGLGYRVVVPDLAGHGGRPAPPPAFTLGDLAEDVAGQLAELTGPLVLAGVSLGGMLAQLCALRPELPVAGLVLANTMSETPAPLRAALARRADRTAQAGMAGMVAETIDRWFTEHTRQTEPALINRVRDWLLAADPAVNAQTWRAIAELSLLGRLAAVNVPALVISGSADRAAPEELAAATAAALPRARRVRFAGVGHLAPLEQPDRFADELHRFIADDVVHRQEGDRA
ncbi:alpha/beta hydrolase [Micromonospora sp. WMMD1082]|uniref:alpha/beta fold hydrolase n=1 Tax=Micromonospora sp. WMMD1082 TaxID=3016104 RepID=UPI0024180F96|nr:alpha/beta hydrolase [Micromonospora sp. WMMD1082]MDG4798340.1 alpha/beta hydrolase [Micromonospora sp. WMMD1082]